MLYYILKDEEFAGLGVSVVHQNIDSPKAVLSIILPEESYCERV